MTYLKTALIASAASALAISTASAGEKHWDKAETKMKSETKTVTTTAKDEMKQDRKMLKAKHDHTVGEILQKDGELHTKADQELLTHDGDKQTKAKIKSWESDNQVADNAIVVPSSAGAATTVSCPVGTTAQPDMTCLVTGNFDADRTQALRMEESEMKTEVAGVVEMDERYNSTEMNMSTSNDMTYGESRTYLDTEYKGTLRPDTVVIENVQNDENYESWTR